MAHLGPEGVRHEPLCKGVWVEQGGSRLTLIHDGLENLPLLHRLMLRMGWGQMLKRLIPKVLSRVEGDRFEPGAVPLEKRRYKCKTVPAEFVR